MNEERTTGEAWRGVGRQAWQKARPHLASVLRQVGDELQKAVSRLEDE